MAAAVSVAVVLVLLVLFAAGILFPSGSSPSSSQWLTYDGAEPAAAQAASASGGGSWLPVIGFGLAVSSNVTVPATNLTGLLAEIHCTASFPGGSSPSVNVPATPSSAGTGRAGFWLIVFRNATGELRAASVTEGAGRVLFSAGGSTCQSDALDLIEISSSVVDSSNAVAAADSAGGSSFLAGHPGASQVWVVFGGANFVIVQTSPTWTVVDTSCSLSSPNGTSGSVFVANESGTGVVISNTTRNAVPCSLGTSLGTLGVPALPVSTILAAKAI